MHGVLEVEVGEVESELAAVGRAEPVDAIPAVGVVVGVVGAAEDAARAGEGRTAHCNSSSSSSRRVSRRPHSETGQQPR